MTLDGLIAVLFILAAHWIADFVLQSDWMAQNKSSSWPALALHVLTYMAGIAVLAVLVLPIAVLPAYLTVNGAAHFVTDAITSRITSWLYRREERHWFFVVIGFDQLIHQATLLGTLYWLA